MGLGIKKCAMFIMKSVKRQIMEGTELLNLKKHQNVWRKEKLQLLGNIRSGYHQTSGNERKIRKYNLRTRKLLKTKLCARNLIKKINIWEVLVVRYSEAFMK